jgi:ferredoxin
VFFKFMGVVTMAMKITDDCVACGACIDACDINFAISEADPIYVIDPALCTECEESGGEPKCVPNCAVEAIVKA